MTVFGNIFFVSLIICTFSVVFALNDRDSNIYDDLFLKVLEPTEIQYLFKLDMGRIGPKFNTTYFNTYLLQTEPEHACTPILNARNLSGAVAFVIRGGCSFVTKAFHAQLAGAVSIIVYDYGRESDAHLNMVQDDTDRKISIPCAFMTGKDGHKIISAVESMGRNYAVVDVPVNLTAFVTRIPVAPWTLW